MSEAAAELGARIYERARLTGEFRLRSGAVSSEGGDIAGRRLALRSLFTIGELHTLAR